MKPVAVLSTTVLPKDGIYSVNTVSKCPSILGVPHYIGHPATVEIVEELGAIRAASRLFTGLEVGEIAVCFPIKSNQRPEGYSNPHQEVTEEDLAVRVLTRLR